MNYFTSKKNIIIQFILFFIIVKQYLSVCITHSFQDLSSPKSKTLFNGYHLMVTSTGIFSLTPKLTQIANSYKFTESQKFSTDTDQMKNTINQVEISQFSTEDGGKEYIILYANNFIYFLSQYGKVQFFQELDADNQIVTGNSITLVAYKYYNGDYYFILGHNKESPNIQLYYYKIINRNQLVLIYKNQIQSSNVLNTDGISCHSMIHLDNSKFLTCILNNKVSSINYITAFSLNPDMGFSYVKMSNTILEGDNRPVKYFRTSIDIDMKYCLICYTIESPDKLKCCYYNSIENKIL